MKKLILLFLFLFSFNRINSQVIYCNPAGSERECFYAYSAVREYIKDTNVVIVFNQMEPLHEAFNGVTWAYSKHLYIVNISPWEKNPLRRIWIIFHEIGHVIDLYNGNLTQFPTTWLGEPVEDNLPWDDRPWEKSADEWAERIWRRVMGGNPPLFFDLEEMINPKNNPVNH